MAWLSGWTKRIKLTIDNTKIDSALSHFPVTVFPSSTHGDCVFDELTSDANRKKIAVTQSDGTTQLYCEIEKWDDASESAILHISKTGWSVSSSADTEFYLYYLSSQSDNTTYIGDIATIPAASVWNSNDKMVQHMVDDTTSTTLDSTSNNNDGTKTAANEPIEAAGKVGQGQDFHASDDEISVIASTSLNGLGDFTFLAVANLPALGSNKTFLFNDLTSTGAFQLWRYQNKCRCAVHGSTFSSTLDVSAGDHLLVAIRSGSTLSLYLDDALLDSFSVATTSMGSNGYLLGKYLANTTYTLDGIMSEARIIGTACSVAWVKATYNSLWDTLLTYGSEELLPIVFADFEEFYGDAWFAQDFEEPYSNRALPFQDFEEIWSFPIHTNYVEPWDIPLGELPRSYVIEYYRDRAAPQIDVVEWYGDKATPTKDFLEPYENQIKIEQDFSESYTLLSNPRTAYDEIYTICDTTVRQDLDETYDLNLRDPARISVVEFYSLLSGVTEVQSYNVAVTVDGTVVQAHNLEISGSLDNYCLSLSMDVATAGDYALCDYGKNAIIIINGETFNFFLEGRSRTKRSGSTIYTIAGLSPICQLDRPETNTLLQVWDTETTAKAVVEGLAGAHIDVVEHPGWWGIVDWMLPPNILYANDESPLDVIKKIVFAAGGVMQAYPDGTLKIQKRYPHPVPNWTTETADCTLSDEADFFNVGESFEYKEGFDKVLVSNQSITDSDTITIEEENVDAQTKRLRCYHLPYSGDFSLQTSGGGWVSIEEIGTTEETLTELIEIVAGAGRTSKPIYSEITADREYKQTQLGAVTFSETGDLITEISGQSLLQITYTTKYKEFLVKSSEIESVQFYAEMS